MSEGRTSHTAARTLRAAALFDGVRFVDTPLLQIEGGSIVAVGNDVHLDGPVADLGDVTLMPGIVDCHQHLVFDGNGTLHEQVAGLTDDQLAERARRLARQALIGGITTVRDLGDRNFVTLPLRGDPDLPTLLCAGPPITPVGGHCWFLGGEVSDAVGLAAAVQARVEHGCDVVKIMVTGGFGTPAMPAWKSQFDADDVAMVTKLAHAAGLPVAAHCHGEEGIRHAVDAGVDTIEHCTFMNEPFAPDPDHRLLVDLANSGIALSATFGRCADAPPPPDVLLRATPLVRNAMRRVLELGGVVVVGSDAGINTAKPHDIAPRAIHDLLDIGMDLTDALASLTSRGADALGLPNKGRLRAGADADVVAVMGDPRDDPDATTRVTGVWRSGIPVDRTSR
ncbi:MAG TPA: amidohydrolase family protein [Ilumatobacteraceae bacterium]|nr:amidohydrolase family protein [Ilumatobacteraceae bacterium]